MSGNLLLHLNGNVTQWIVASFNRLDDERERPTEFSEREQLAGKVLLDRLGTTLDEVAKVLARLTPDDLAATYHIQGYTVKGLDAIYQVVEHSVCTTARFSTSPRRCVVRISASFAN